MKSASISTATIPRDRLAGLKENWKTDIVSGFILFLIALPLCLGIAIASGMPPMSGIIAAVVGGILVSQVSGSFVTINGPAAGLIVVILASVDRLGGGSAGYHATLAAIVIAGAILFVLGMCKAGELGEFFPASVVHGMLASIGVIIMSKQLPFVLGVKPPAKEPLALIAKIPEMVMGMNPEIAIIGLVSLAILIVHALVGNKAIKKIPAPIIVVLVAIALGSYFNLEHAHTYSMLSQAYKIDPKFLVQLPSHVADAITNPNFTQIGTAAFWLSVVSITLIQGVESVLSCAAVDTLDPWKRRSNLSRDVAAVGLGSAISGMIGGLPMIAEIVRSTANVANGARTRWSNFFHGSFMLVFVLVGAALINKIPLAALAAILVFTGYRLASPKVFKDTHEIGFDQTIIFVVTLVTTLATDLLIGVIVGVLTKLLLHIIKGTPPARLFSANVETSTNGDGSFVVAVKDAAIFSNYLSLKKHLNSIPRKGKVRLDLSKAKLIDHTVMDRLHTFEQDYISEGGEFALSGLENHKPTSKHRFSSRRL